MAFEKASAMIRNGIAKPTEKTVSINPPVKAVPDVPARRRIDPRIGPTHGVHPRAKVPPINRELDGLPRVNHEGIGIFLSDCQNKYIHTLAKIFDNQKKTLRIKKN